MLDASADGSWQDLRERGYVHIRKFLTEVELLVLQKDWADRAKEHGVSVSGNYPLFNIPQIIIWRFHRKLKVVTEAVCRATGVNADTDAGAIYFSTTKGINLGWHQDHESYFMYQQHRDYLNFYIPIVKPNARLTNLCVIPMDRLRLRIPEHFGNFVGSGAKNFYPGGGETIVHDDENGSEYALPVNLEELKDTPELEPGDLLLLRGDVIHRTQDTETDRVAASFRRINSLAVIRKAKFQEGSPKKQDMMRKNGELYKPMFDCFSELGTDEVTVRQFHSYVIRKATSSVPGSSPW